jgi:putative transposase
MRWLFQPLLMLVASSTESELARQVEFLMAENQMLRMRLPKAIRFTDEEKSLIVKLGQAIGAKVKSLLTVASYPSYRRWVNQIDPPAPGTHPNNPKSKPGRRRTSDEIRELVMKLATENDDWGYTRILGELKKLGITTSRSNVVNILKASRIDPKLDPTKGTWGEFLKAHAQTLWQCDFFSKHITDGVRQCFILAFVHVATRRVFLSPCTFRPEPMWMREQARAFQNYAKLNALPVEVVVRDRDSNFRDYDFDSEMKWVGVDVLKLSFRSPNLNAYVERFIQTIQQECLDKFICFGTEHLDLLTREFATHYHEERPHQAKGNQPLVAPSCTPVSEGEVVCSERLGGVLKHYHRKAA